MAVIKHPSAATGGGDWADDLGTGAEIDGVASFKSQSSSASATADYTKLYALDEGAAADANIKLLLHGQGANASTTITDSSQVGATIANTGTVISTAQSKFGGSPQASILFDRSASTKLVVPTLANFVAAGDFTWSFFLYLNTKDARQGLIRDSDSDDIYFQVSSGNILNVGFRNASGGGAKYAHATTALDTGQWYHVAVSRDGTDLKTWLNGTLEATEATMFTGAIQSRGSTLVIGLYDSSHFLDGYLQELTFTAGAVFDGTVPTSPVDGTSALYALDQNSNETKISPHNSKGEWEYYSKNTKTGKTVRINMEEVVSDLGKLTGKNYIKDE